MTERRRNDRRKIQTGRSAGRRSTDSIQKRDALLNAAAARYGLTRRERDVLALTLDGQSVRHIAVSLCLAPSTVQDHVVRLMEKAGARNKISLVALILGWPSAPAP